jgi:hypothetical protein
MFVAMLATETNTIPLRRADTRRLWPFVEDPLEAEPGGP